MCVYIYIYRERERERMKEIYFRELTHVIVEVDRSEIYRTGQQSGNSSRSQCCHLESKSNLESEFLPS